MYLSLPCALTPLRPYALSLIPDDRAAPSFLVSHELPLDQAPEAYQHFDARENGWTKVVLHPGVTARRKPRARRPGFATAGEDSDAVATPS
jgi:hypothetical protein